VVAGYEVARDVVINTVLSNGMVTDVAAYLLYEIVEEDGALRLSRIGAHWEMTQTLLSTMSQGLRGLSSVMAVSWRLLRVQGLIGMMGYSRGILPGIGGAGVTTLEKFAQAVSDRDAHELQALFVENDAAVEWPIGTRRKPEELLKQLPAGARWHFERPKSSGYVTACRFTLTAETGPTRSGIAFFHFDKDSRRIAQARFFEADSPSENTSS
jgi:hypothetical protein